MVICFCCFLRLLQSHLPSKDKRVHWHAEKNYGHPFPSPSRDKRVWWHAETIKVIRFCCFFKTITVSFSIQRQASLLACGDLHGYPLSLFLRLLQSPLPSRDKQVYSHAETIMVICFFLLFSRLLQSSLPSSDKLVCWHARTISVFRSLFF